MKNRFKTMGGVFTLTSMLLFGAVAFAHSNANVAKANLSSTGAPARNEQESRRRHRRHHRRWKMRRMDRR
jgi:hypothetical protein